MGGFPTFHIPQTHHNEGLFAPFPPIKQHIANNALNSLYTKMPPEIGNFLVRAVFNGKFAFSYPSG